MSQFLVAIHHPDDYDGSLESDAMRADITALNKDMVAAGIRVFVGGLRPAKEAVSVRPAPNAALTVTDGPYLETKEHIGGFWVLELPDMKTALDWGRKAAIACRSPVEVREFN